MIQFKLVHGPFGQGTMHSILDLCPRPSRKEKNVPLHKRSQELAVPIYKLCYVLSAWTLSSELTTFLSALSTKLRGYKTEKDRLFKSLFFNLNKTSLFIDVFSGNLKIPESWNNNLLIFFSIKGSKHNLQWLKPIW